MKKIWMILMICLMCCSCADAPELSQIRNTPESQSVVKTTPTPQSTVETEMDDEHSQDDETVDLGTDTEIVDETIVYDSVFQASYIEETDVNPTTLTFTLDGMVETNLNVCSTMVYLTGKYTKEEQTVVLELEDTGYDFLDNVQFKFNIIEDKLMLDETSEMFSCSGIDTYVIREVEE